jgi:hypothetical protein
VRIPLKPSSAPTDINSMRWRILGVAATIAATTLTPGAVALASPGQESEFFSLMNSARASAGLAPLASDSALTAYARNHTATMIASGTIFHSSGLGSITTGWTRMGENVGMGPTPSIIHQAFMASPGHRANILGDYNYAGIGADTSPDGTIFVTVVFMKKGETAATTTTTQAPATTQAPTTSAAVPLPVVNQPAPPAPAPRSTATTTAPAADPAPVAPVVPLLSPPDLCGSQTSGPICLD